MDKNGKDEFRAMVGGWIGGCGCSIPLLFTGTHHIFEFSVKFVGLMVAGFVTGLFTVMGNDFYKLKIKPKLFKDKIKKDDERPGV